ncbi:hypothetical protein ILP97_32835 [Amycolatopsis sp. H6(2020)]|nr:hypothetical protein [Amycolatopsis sp. H6(2020)]
MRPAPVVPGVATFARDVRQRFARAGRSTAPRSHGAAPAGGVPLSEALPHRLWEDGSLPLLLALRAAAAWHAARV